MPAAFGHGCGDDGEGSQEDDERRDEDDGYSRRRVRKR